MCESVGDFYDYLHEILDKHEANYNIEDGTFYKDFQKGFSREKTFPAKLRQGDPIEKLRRQFP